MSYSKSIELLRDYVAIPSVNPMGRSDMPAAIAGETRLAEHLLEQLRGMGFDARCIGEGDRQSVVAEVTVSGAIDTLLFASHIDTVPIDGMEIDPFDPVVTGGRLQGRGSCDTKAGMAAFVAALEKTAANGSLRRNVVLLGEADEEFGGLGVDDSLAAFASTALDIDWVLASEPTNLQVVHAHKGVAFVRLETHGRACHASAPDDGENALVALARVITALDDHAADLALRSHPQLGPPTLSVGRAGGGTASNIVPDAAWLELDRRLVPGENAESIRRDIEGVLAAAGVDGVSISLCAAKAPLETPLDHAAVRSCIKALESAGLPPETTSVAFGTDAGPFAEAGLPGVVLGPGSIEQAHTSREFIETAQVDAATRLFEALLSGETPSE